jgi:hypothetical protein
LLRLKIILKTSRKISEQAFITKTGILPISTGLDGYSRRFTALQTSKLETDINTNKLDVLNSKMENVLGGNCFKVLSEGLSKFTGI